MHRLPLLGLDCPGVTQVKGQDNSSLEVMELKMGLTTGPGSPPRPGTPLGPR